VKDVIATGLEVPEGPVVLPDGRIAFVEQVRGQVSVHDGTEGRAVEYVTTDVAGQPLLAPNDLCFGADGRLWFTDPGHPYDPLRRGANGRLIAIGRGRDEIVADVGPVYCNGLAFGVDGRLVWVESYRPARVPPRRQRP